MDNSNVSLTDVACPFCGLACDDLALKKSDDGLAVTANGCAVSVAAFSELSKHDARNASPRLDGRPVALEKAINAAAQLIGNSTAPLIAGLGTDVAGARALLQLADRIHAYVDHMNMSAKLRNVLTLQNGGWITTTLAEVKNRADFVLVLGSSAVTRFPRLLERVVWPTDAMFVDGNDKREVVFLGEFNGTEIKRDGPAQIFHCEHRSLTRLLPALRALCNGQPTNPQQVAASDWKTLAQIAEKIARAKYGVIVWSAGDFDFPHGELTVQVIAELLKDLNKNGRFAGLPLGGNDGDLTSNGVQTWQSGLSLRSRYGKNGIDYDPERYGTERLLAENEVDLMVWVSSFTARKTPPATAIPQIVLGPPAMKLEREPRVFIPVGTPGIHHGGHFVRTDKVVIARLRPLLATQIPSVASISEKILTALCCRVPTARHPMKAASQPCLGQNQP